jgi:D-serine deaminase-like pyridoxal phosphate-dependent protein
MPTYLEWREVLKNERLPAVVVDLDAFDRNIDKLRDIVKVNSKRLRLATKSVRVPELIVFFGRRD